MNNIVIQIKRSFTVVTALIITVFTTRIRAVSFLTCGPEELAQCGETLSVLTDSGLNFVRSKQDIDMMCPDLKKSLDCIHSYSRLCMNLAQRKHFRKLFHGTGQMFHDLCRNETYQEEFLMHAPCMQRVSPDTEVCFKKYSTAMTEIQSATNNNPEETHRSHYHHHHHPHHKHNKTEEELYKYQKAKREAADDSLRSVCCSFQEYIDCSTQTIKKSCGPHAAQFSRDFLDKMASSLIKMHCMDFSPKECRDKGYNVDGFHTEGLYSAAPSLLSSLIQILSIICVFLFLR